MCYPSSLRAVSEIERDKGRWSDLLPELIELVSEKINDISDYIRFRTVCRSWRSATSSGSTKYLRTHQVPWLMLLDVHNPQSSNCYFISLVANKVYTINLPELCSSGRVLCGTCQGWLVVLDVTESAADVFLLNPVTRAQLQLPPATDFPRELGLRVERGDNNYYKVHREGEVRELDFYHYAHKVYIGHASLSASPTLSQDCIVMAVLYRSSKFAFCRLGDDAWTLMDSKLPYHVSSVAYHDTNFYIVDKFGNTAICSSDSRTTATLIPSMKVPTNFSHISNFVESCGELLLLSYARNGEERSGWVFRIFKVDGSCRQGPLKWSEIRSTNHALFGSEHHFSSSYCSGSNPGFVAANCIYFPSHSEIFPSQSNGFRKERSDYPGRQIYRYTVHSNQVVKDSGFQLLLRNWKLADVRYYWFTPTL